MDVLIKNKNPMKKKIFITGIAGFIGFHVACFLKKQGHDVVGLDNFNDYYDKKLKYARSQILKNLGIEIFAKDIRDSSFLQTIFQTEKPTHLIHLAAQAGVRHSITHPEEYVGSNLDGFVRVLEACRSFSFEKILFASSSSVYGLNKKIPFSIEDPTDSPANLYGATKKANELIAYAYHHLYKLPLIGLRFFSVYGPWGRPDMAYYSFTKKILENQPLPLFNFGKMKRDFTYIDDIVAGTVKALDLPSNFEIFNLGSHHPVSLLELVQSLEKHLNKKATLEFLEKQPGEAEITYADIEKSQKYLQFNPNVSLDEGIFRFVTWYKEYHRPVETDAKLLVDSQ
jgi:UDP-glucuronate 4-epimerase